MGSGRIRQECEADKSVRQYPGTRRDPKPKNPQTFFPVTELRPSPEKGVRIFWLFQFPEHRGWSAVLRFAQEASRHELFLCLSSVVASFSRLGAHLSTREPGRSCSRSCRVRIQCQSQLGWHRSASPGRQSSGARLKLACGGLLLACGGLLLHLRPSLRGTSRGCKARERGERGERGMPK